MLQSLIDSNEDQFVNIDDYRFLLVCFGFFFSDPIGFVSLYGPDHSQTVAAAAVTISPIVFVTPSFLMEIIILLYKRQMKKKRTKNEKKEKKRK